MICAVCAYFNFHNSERIKENYFRFLKNFPKNIPLFTIEASFGEFITNAEIKIKANPSNQFMWQKERLLNLITDRLDKEYTHIIFTDSDLLFEDGWDEQIIKSLEYDAVQCFSKINLLDIKEEVLESYISSAKSHIYKLDGIGYPFSVWMFKRETLKYGLFDRSILGNSDIGIERAIFNKTETWPKIYYTKAEYECYKQWANKFNITSVGCIESTIKHLYHGTKQNRQYNEKQKILINNNYNPFIDIQIAKNGLFSWSSHKPELHKQVREYFSSRQEDK